MYPGLNHKPFEVVERDLEPPEPKIEGPGYYNSFSDDFIPDDEAFEYALENWDLMSKQKRDLFERFLVDTFFEDWERVKDDSI